jgi:hypothetical protein
MDNLAGAMAFLGGSREDLDATESYLAYTMNDLASSRKELDDAIFDITPP